MQKDLDGLADTIDPPKHRLVKSGSAGIRSARGATGRVRRWGFRRACVTGMAFLASILFLGLIAGGVFFMRLAQGPIDVDLGQQITQALGERVGGGYAFAIGATSIEQTDHGPTLSLRQLTIKDHAGRTVMAAPRAGIAVSPFELFFGRVSPKRLEVQDILMRVVRLEDGAIAISAGADQIADTPLTTIFASAAEVVTPAAPNQTAVVNGETPMLASDARPAKRFPRELAAVVAKVVDTVFDPASPFRALDRFGIKRGTLVVEDRLRKASMTYKNFEVDFDREANGGIYLTADADGPSGHWSFSARVNQASDGTKMLDLTVDHLSMDEMMLAAGLRTMPFDTDMPLSLNMNMAAAADGSLTSAEGHLSLGSGYFRLDDPDHEPAMVDGIDVTLRVDPATGEVDFGRGNLKAGESSFQFGVRAIPPETNGAPWHVVGTSTGIFGTERPGEQPIKLDAIDMKIDVDMPAKKVVVQNFSVRGPDVAFRMDAVFQGNDTGGFLITSTMDTGRMPGPVVIRLWPNWVASPPRAWFLANLKGGTLDYGRGKFALTDVDLETMKHQHSVPDDHSHIEFGVSNASLTFMNGVPPLKGLDGNGVLTGDTLTFAASKGEMEVSPGRKLFLSDGTFTIPSTDPKPSPAVIALRITGGIDAMADLLARDALKPYADLPIDASSVSGQIDGRMTINLKVGDHVPPDETKIGVVAVAKDFFVDKVIGKEPLEDATVNIVADKAGIHARGEGRMYGAPATIDLKKPAGTAPSEAVVSITLDDAARAKAGFTLGKSVTGPISAKISTTLSGGESGKASIDVDLTRAVLDSPLPGLKKAAGKASKATFTATQQSDGVQLDQIVFDSGATSIRGSAELDSKGGFEGAKLTQLRLSPGDDMRADITVTNEGLKLVVKGSNVDARPFLKSLTTGDSGSSNDATTKDLDLDLHANILTGQNSQALTNADLRLVRRNGNFRRVQMTGRLGKGTLSANTVGQGANSTIVIAAKDAGATLSFLDLYKRMDGGRLDTTLKFVDGRMDGYTVVHDFTIKEDPAIKKLASEEIPGDSRNAGARIDTSATRFTKLEAYFSRVGNKIEVRQGSMFGPQVGATVEGWIDFAHDRVALNGTFVPIYGLNNLFSQIPVVGMLLGGGAHEGLFALNYRIDGSASSPVLSFNPLSALAPGFLRKIFGAIDNAAQQGIDPSAASTIPQGDHAVGPAGGLVPN
ncbi:DUF3971 domain-containing protein [Lichenihabitans psoromatis]|uniref:YhdP family protein n=1 Tax=Lichenihabitans psoromatis TaxID=2528642 RepID=UPI0010383E99|nr:AsmA-like C-terminal region-containing protein [Lichenihabitans psoromatis]